MTRRKECDRQMSRHVFVPPRDPLSATITSTVYSHTCAASADNCAPRVTSLL